MRVWGIDNSAKILGFSRAEETDDSGRLLRSRGCLNVREDSRKAEITCVHDDGGCTMEEAEVV